MSGPPNASQPSVGKHVPEAAFYISLGALTLLAASLPYLFGLANTPPGGVFTGLTYNIDDTAVYLSWMRQVGNGSLFQRNLFAVESQKGMVINLFGLLLGGFAKVTGLPLVLMYHLFRVLFGGLLLWAVYRLIQSTIKDDRARRLAFALVCVGSGLGWLFGGYDPAKGDNQPIDLWQPEAITFLSLYYAPLFTAAQALMVVFIGAVLKHERTGKLTDIIPAAVAGFLLGNFHTYDVVPLFGSWLAFRITTDAFTRKPNAGGWLALILAGAATLPTLAYQYFALLQDPIFQARNVMTLSPALPWLLLGFGIPAALALVGIALPAARDRFADRHAFRLLVCWLGVAVVAAYLPVAVQRKFLMGAHLPLCLLAGAGLAAMVARLTGGLPAIASFALVALTAPSNILWLLRDMDRLSANVGSTEVRPYLTRGEYDALEWLRTNTRPSDVVFCAPDPQSHKRFPFFPFKPYLSILVPAWSGNTVYNGHGSETPEYGRKLNETRQFFREGMPDEGRRAFVREHGIKYILVPNGMADGFRDPDGQPLIDPAGPYIPVGWPERNVPEWLKEAYKNPDITLYAVRE